MTPELRAEKIVNQFPVLDTFERNGLLELIAAEIQAAVEEAIANEFAKDALDQQRQYARSEALEDAAKIAEEHKEWNEAMDAYWIPGWRIVEKIRALKERE